MFAVAPAIGNNVELRESLALACVYITLASNLNLMLGYAGYINFGSIVFFGLGGYICVWLVERLFLAACREPARGRRRRRARWRCCSASASCGCAVAFFALATIGIVEGGAGFCREFHAVGRLVRHLYLAARCSARSAVRHGRCG